MGAKTLERYNYLVSIGYTVKERECVICGDDIVLMNGIVSSVDNTRIFLRKVCRKCGRSGERRKRVRYVLPEEIKAPLRHLRKLYGATDWEDDKGRALLDEVERTTEISLCDS